MIFKTEPYKYQENAVKKSIQILNEHKFLALFGEVGTGKTKIAIDIFQNSRSIMNHMVIICPKNLFGTWVKEIKRHSDIHDWKVHRWDKIWAKKSTMPKYIANMLASTG